MSAKDILEPFGFWNLVFAKQFFAGSPFKALGRARKDIACVSGSGRFSATAAITMIENARFAFDFVADGAAQATALKDR